MVDFIKKLWNPVAFWISLMMTFFMPLIFGVLPGYLGFGGITVDRYLMMWPLRWLVAYLLLNLFVRPTAIKLAKRVFGFTPN